MILQLSAAIPALIQAGTGIFKGIQSAVQRGKAKRLQAPLVDPEERERLRKLEREQRSFETGSAFQASRRRLGQTLAATQRGITRAGGGDIGSIIAGLSRSQRVANVGVGQLQAQGQAQQNIVGHQISQLATRISQRKLDLQNLREERLLARAAQGERESFANISGAIAENINVGGGSALNTTTTQQPQQIFNPLFGNIGATQDFLRRRGGIQQRFNA